MKELHNNAIRQENYRKQSRARKNPFYDIEVSLKKQSKKCKCKVTID